MSIFIKLIIVETLNCLLVIMITELRLTRKINQGTYFVMSLVVTYNPMYMAAFLLSFLYTNMLCSVL